MKLNRFLWMLGICLSLLLCITSCTGGETPSESDTLPPDQVTDASTGDAPQEGTETDTEGDTQEDTEAETDKVYADIGDGSFTLLQDTYYAVVGGTFKPEGKFSFDEPDTVTLTPRVDAEGVIRANEDGTVTASRIKLEVWGGVLSVELCEIEIYWN
jgi:hypothetical protein